MPRTNCPAREGRSEQQLAILDAVDLPACLVFTDQPPQPLPPPNVGYGPCSDCLPAPTFREALAARWRRAMRRLHG